MGLLNKKVAEPKPKKEKEVNGETKETINIVPRLAGAVIVAAIMFLSLVIFFHSTDKNNSEVPASTVETVSVVIGEDEEPLEEEVVNLKTYISNMPVNVEVNIKNTISYKENNKEQNISKEYMSGIFSDDKGVSAYTSGKIDNKTYSYLYLMTESVGLYESIDGGEYVSVEDAKFSSVDYLNLLGLAYLNISNGSEYSYENGVYTLSVSSAELVGINLLDNSYTYPVSVKLTIKDNQISEVTYSCENIDVASNTEDTDVNVHINNMKCTITLNKEVTKHYSK